MQMHLLQRRIEIMLFYVILVLERSFLMAFAASWAIHISEQAVYFFEVVFLWSWLQCLTRAIAARTERN